MPRRAFPVLPGGLRHEKYSPGAPFTLRRFRSILTVLSLPGDPLTGANPYPAMKMQVLISLACLGTASAFAMLEPETPLPNVAGPAWFDGYYQNPRPQDFLMAVHSLSASGRLDDASQVATAIGFFATVFEAHRRILAAAAWKAGHTAGARLLREMSASDDALSAEIAALASQAPSSVSDTPVLSPSSLNLQWGAYLASGDSRHIVAIVAALGSQQPGLGHSAVMTLARNAVTHPEVLTICRAEMERQPAAVREMFSTALATGANRPGA